MTSNAGIGSVNDLMQTLYELEAKVQYLLDVMDREHPKKLLRQAKNAFRALKYISILSNRAGVFIVTIEQRLHKIYGELYQVKKVAEQREGRIWQKFIGFIKDAIEVIANMTAVIPLVATGVMFAVPELINLSHLVRF